LGVLLGVIACLALSCVPKGAARGGPPGERPLFEETFEEGVGDWEPTDAAAWRVEEVDGNKVYSQFGKSDYEPPHRSPFNISLRKEVDVGDFVLEARLRSTVADYGHRDMCLVFGYQDPAHFYYVHFGKQTDDHANQVFIVNGAPRVKISKLTSEGTPWDDEWHRVKIVRQVEDGTISVYFDDMDRPVMIARDKSFTHGRIGIGSFDDTGQWDDVKLFGTQYKTP
jgi:hypothetical protein